MKPTIPLFASFIYLTALVNSRGTNGLSSDFVEVHKLSNIDAITEFPLDYQETETTTEGLHYNVTLDTRLVNDTDRNWKYSPLSLKKWFEYYNDTTHLINFTNNETSCAHVVSDTANKLDWKDGIWVSCHDSTLNEECLIARPCYPEFSYIFGNVLAPMRTVKIYLSLRGLAIVRLTFGSTSIENRNCFDYSRREDPFSICKYIQVNSTNEWVVIRSGFDGYDNEFFSSFTVSLITRFKNDVALVDKIEVTDYLLCGYAEGNCTTTSPGPSRSTSTSTTLFPPTTNETSGIPESSTTKPTTKCPVRITTKKLSLIQVSNISILETRDDHIPIQNGWEISPETPRWLEYYIDSNSLKGHSNNRSTCANILPSSFDNLSDVVGLWGTCTENSQSLNCSDKLNASCHPFINYNAPEGQYVFSVRTYFFLHNLAILRLHVGDDCLDYSFEDTHSTCKYIRIIQDGNYWRSFYWSSDWSSQYEKLASFRLELISTSETDILLVDKVQVEYMQCSNGNCTSEPTTTVNPTADLTTETEYYDCDEYEDTTIPYTTENESDPPITTEDAVSSTSDDSKNPSTLDTDPTTDLTTTPKTAYSTSPHSMVPTIFTLLLGAVITFANWKY